MNESFIHYESWKMPRSALANQQIREETTKKILDAAMTVFGRRGSGATMSEVAAEAGVSQGLAYRYFPSKEAILTALVQRTSQSGGPLSERVKRMRGTPAEKLTAVLTSMIELRRSRPGFYQFLHRALSDEKLPDELRETVGRQGRVSQEILKGLIVEGQATGELPQDDPDQLLEAIMASLTGLTARMAMLDPSQVDKRLPDAKIFLRMLRPEV